MSVIIKTQGSLFTIEGKSNAAFKKERLDIKKLLLKLKSGEKLSNIFPMISIEYSVKNLLINANFIDALENLTTQGENFINYPYFSETENGLFTFSIYDFSLLHNSHLAMLIEAERKLSNKIDSNGMYGSNHGEFYNDNEFVIGNNGEKYVFDKVEHLENYNITSNSSLELEFDVENCTYNYLGQTLKTGSKFNGILKNETIELLRDQNFYNYNPDLNKIIIDDFGIVTDQELLSGKLKEKILNQIKFKDVDLLIKDSNFAYKYCYFYLYDLINNGNYLNLSEMNEIYFNELLTREIFDENVKEALQSKRINLAGFKENLSEDKYERLQYKLRIMETLLNKENLNDSKEFNDLRNYEDFVKYLSINTPLNNSKNIYLVMGYAFTKNKSNRILDFLDEILKENKNITIIDKHVGPMKFDYEIREQVLDKGVSIKEVPSISTNFHDRYIIFETNEGKIEYYLISADVGQIFETITHETKGIFIKMKNEDVIKNNRSLIDFIKGGEN